MRAIILISALIISDAIETHHIKRKNSNSDTYIFVILCALIYAIILDLTE